jgi:hypothetical protein
MAYQEARGRIKRMKSKLARFFSTFELKIH